MWFCGRTVVCTSQVPIGNRITAAVASIGMAFLGVGASVEYWSEVATVPG